MIGWLKRWWNREFPQYVEVDHKFVPYLEGVKMIRDTADLESDQQWVLSELEYRNGCIGFVLLCRRFKLRVDED